jgi:hypothetical protein
MSIKTKLAKLEAAAGEGQGVNPAALYDDSPGSPTDESDLTGTIWEDPLVRYQREHADGDETAAK